MTAKKKAYKRYLAYYDSRELNTPKFQIVGDMIERVLGGCCLAFWRPGMWLIKSDKGPRGIYEHLSGLIKLTDRFLIIEVNNNYAGQFSGDCLDGIDRLMSKATEKKNASKAKLRRSYAMYYRGRHTKQKGKNLTREFKRSGEWWSYLECMGFFAAREDIAEAWERMSPYIYKDDQLLLIEVKNNYAGRMPKVAWVDMEKAIFKKPNKCS